MAKRRRKKKSPSPSRWFKFRYVVLVLVAAFVYKHGVHLRLGQERFAEATSRVDATPAKAQLASFEHRSTLTAAEVADLRKAYIRTYAPIAVEEMERSGIPASITLAQGLLESVAGTSRLATATNNHFGMKCFSKSCTAGHCRNFDDDHHKDFFRSYAHPRESYRAHSEFLQQGSRYASLFSFRQNDYRSWAKGLSKAGYATDPAYADKLISLIQRYELYGYDE